MDKKYFIIVILFFISLIGLANIIFNIKDFFVPELFVLLLFLVSAVIITNAFYNQRKEAWIMSLFFFAAYLINITFVYFYSKNQLLFVLLMLITIIGFILSIENIKGKIRIRSKYEKEVLREADELVNAEKHLEEKLPDIFIEELKPSKQDVELKVKDLKKKEIEKKPLKEYNYVASRKGVNYHELGCRWARKILPKRKIWLKDKKEAEEEGFKPCKCVK